MSKRQYVTPANIYRHRRFVFCRDLQTNRKILVRNKYDMIIIHNKYSSMYIVHTFLLLFEKMPLAGYC